MNRTDLKKVLQYLQEGNVERAKGFLTGKLETIEAKAIKLGKLIDLELTNGDKEPVFVKAFPVGKYFAIHHPSDYGKTWTITHVPSGLAATGQIRRKNLAVLYAKAFADLPAPWENKEPLRGIDSVTMTALTELAQAARDNKPLPAKVITDALMDF